MLRFTGIYFCLIALLLAGCAQVVAPTGGPKDEQPPRVVRVFPKDQTTHFNAPEITIQFDEFIQLNNPTEQVVISPVLEKKPEFLLEGKKLVVNLSGQKLRPNTTYTINFGNAVGDLHENNLSSNLTYVFSTGTFIDSLFVQGACLNAFSHVPEKNLTVGLYPASGFTDSTVYNERPAYFARCNTQGQFRIQHIPADSFFIVAFADENKNLLYNHPEQIGFQSSVFYSSMKDSIPAALYMYAPDLFDEGKLLDTSYREKGKYVFSWYQVSPSKLLSRDKEDLIWRTRGRNNTDTLIIWRKQDDSVQYFHLTVNDSDRVVPLRTRSGLKSPSFHVSIDRPIELGDSIRFTAATPFSTIDTSRVKWMEDTCMLPIPNIVRHPDRKTFSFYYPLKEARRYTLEIMDSAFTDVYGQFSTSSKYQWNTRTLADYGLLKLSVMNPTGAPVIMMFLNEQETQVIKEYEIRGNTRILMEYLNPGTYKLKFILDENKNHQWDNGRFMSRIQPERIYYFPEPLILRANWDVEQVVDITPLVESKIR